MQKDKLENSDFCDVEEASKMLNISIFTVRKLCREGKIKAFKKLKKWYLFKNDIINFLKS